MGISRDLVISKFLDGKKCRRGNIYTDGEAIFSFGDHWPLAIRLPGGSYLVNGDRYGSQSTSIHTSDVSFALRHERTTEASCEEMMNYLRSYPKPETVVLYRRKLPENVGEIVSDVQSLYMNNIGDHNHFPHQRIQNMISDEMLWHQFKSSSTNTIRYFLTKMTAHKFDPMFKIACTQAAKGVYGAVLAIEENLNRSLAKRRHIYSGSRALAKSVYKFKGVIRPRVGAVYLLAGDPIEIDSYVDGYDNSAPTPRLMGEYLNMKATITTVSESDAKKMITDAVMENL